MTAPKALIIRTSGTNCDLETSEALRRYGAECEKKHINEILVDKEQIFNYGLIVFPGGFADGDYISSGKILANTIKNNLKDELIRFNLEGKLILGICNGFQMLVKSGFLPNIEGKLEQETTLTFNESLKFEDRWIYLKKVGNMPNLFLKDIDVMRVPINHGEGRFVPKDNETLKTMYRLGMIGLKYCFDDGLVANKIYPANPNGSIDDIAGISDRTGRIFGLMPHPEKCLTPYHFPDWSRGNTKEEDSSLMIFKNAIDYLKKG